MPVELQVAQALTAIGATIFAGFFFIPYMIEMRRNSRDGLILLRHTSGEWNTVIAQAKKLLDEMKSGDVVDKIEDMGKGIQQSLDKLIDVFTKPLPLPLKGARNDKLNLSGSSSGENNEQTGSNVSKEKEHWDAT